MKKKILLGVIAGICGTSLAACGGAANSGSTTETTTETTTAETSTTASDTTSVSKSDVENIKEKGTLIVGITDFEPMDYQSNGEWVGFDADLAKMVAEDLGVEVKFTEIDWDNKILELDSNSIDVVWNGMTLTDEVKKSMECTDPYLNNAQVVVVKSDKAADYKDEDSIKDLTFAVESGSAGEAVATEKGYKTTPVTAQADTLTEVKSGTSDAAIIDTSSFPSAFPAAAIPVAKDAAAVAVGLLIILFYSHVQTSADFLNAVHRRENGVDIKIDVGVVHVYSFASQIFENCKQPDGIIARVFEIRVISDDHFDLLSVRKHCASFVIFLYLLLKVAYHEIKLCCVLVVFFEDRGELRVKAELFSEFVFIYRYVEYDFCFFLMCLMGVFHGLLLILPLYSKFFDMSLFFSPACMICAG